VVRIADSSMLAPSAIRRAKRWENGTSPGHTAMRGEMRGEMSMMRDIVGS